MTCEICGGEACTRSFHSFADQDAHDNAAQECDECKVKDIQIADLEAELDAAITPENNPLSDSQMAAIDEENERNTELIERTRPAEPDKPQRTDAQ